MTHEFLVAVWLNDVMTIKTIVEGNNPETALRMLEVLIESMKKERDDEESV